MPLRSLEKGRQQIRREHAQRLPALHAGGRHAGFGAADDRPLDGTRRAPSARRCRSPGRPEAQALDDREGRPAGAVAGAELRGGGVRHQARHAPGVDALLGDVGVVDAGLDGVGAADAGADDGRGARGPGGPAPASPAWAMASAPATRANWVKRSQKGRIAASIWAAGSNPFSCAPMRILLRTGRSSVERADQAAALARRRPQRLGSRGRRP